MLLRKHVRERISRKGETMANVKQSARTKTERMTRIAVCTAIIAVCSQLVVPMTIPFTMQTFAVFFALLMLGAVDGLVSIALYILLGAVGAPVFAGFSGGLSRITGPTGGFIVGFFITALCFLIGERLRANSRVVRIASLIAGLALCYCFGAL